MNLIRQSIREAAPVLGLLTVVVAVCGYFLFIDDYVADTGPILSRAFSCMLGVAGALAVGSGVVTFRAPDNPLGRGLRAGTIGLVCVIVLLLILSQGEDVLEVIGTTALIGLAVTAVGAVLGLIARGGP